MSPTLSIQGCIVFEFVFIKLLLTANRVETLQISSNSTRSLAFKVDPDFY